MNKTRKIIDILCAIFWSLEVIQGIYYAAVGKSVHPVLFLCATALCVTLYGDRVLNEMIKDAEKELDPRVAYICDGTACETCSASDWYRCNHTTDIHHAANFKQIYPGVFVEVSEKEKKPND